MTAGRPYRHQLFQLILSHSGWRYAELANGETFLALQRDCRPLSEPWAASPRWRSDNTSAATHEMRRSGGRALNDNYGPAGALRPPVHPHQPWPSHENGVAEQGHYRLKDAIDQALTLRGSRD